MISLRNCSWLLAGLCSSFTVLNSQAADAAAPAPVAAAPTSSISGSACAEMEVELIKKMLENEQYALNLLKGVVDKQTADAAAPSFVEVASRRAAFRGAVYSLGYTMQELNALRNLEALKHVMQISNDVEAEIKRIKSDSVAAYGSEELLKAMDGKTLPEANVEKFAALMQETVKLMQEMDSACANAADFTRNKVLASYFPQVAELSLKWQLFSQYTTEIPVELVGAYRAVENDMMAATDDITPLFVAGESREYASVVVHMLPPVGNAVLKRIKDTPALQNAMLDDLIAAYNEINDALESVNSEISAELSVSRIQNLLSSHKGLVARAYGFVIWGDDQKFPKVQVLRALTRVFDSLVRELNALEKPFYGNEELKKLMYSHIGVTH